MFTLIPTYHQLGEEIHMHTVYNEISPYLLMELPLYYWNVCRFLTDTVVINTCNRIIKRFRNIVNLYKLKYKKKQPKKQKQTKNKTANPSSMYTPIIWRRKKNHKSKLLDQQGANLLKGKTKSLTWTDNDQITILDCIVIINGTELMCSMYSH